jgi:diaminopimelate decarboxylase
MEVQSIEQLNREYGEAFYIFDEKKFVSNLNQVQYEFEKRYNNFKIAYSFKTNYIPRVCQLALRQGALAEVVSEMEYEHALNLGFPPEQIIFNGPVKTKKILFKAFENNSIVHFDSEKEIDYLEEYLTNFSNKKIRCALRINFELSGVKTSRFGFNYEDGSVLKNYNRLFGLKGCEPIGIHCHFQTSLKSLESFSERTEKIITIAKEVFKDRYLEYIDIGGGFYGKMPVELKKQFSNKIPDYDEYAEVVTSEFIKSFPDQNIKLIIEPGNMVVADTFKFYCSVYDIKTNNNKTFVEVNGSIHNIKPNGRSRILPVLKVIKLGKEKSRYVSRADITGYTCIEDDILAHDFSGDVAIGDFFEFSNVGAYSIMLKPPFIKGQPVILSKTENNEFKIIKEEETIDYIFSKYKF